MNLSILLTDFIDTQGILKTYRFVPINPYNRVVVDKLEDICADIKGNTDKDIGLLRVYNSDKCELHLSTCKINNFSNNANKISFLFEHMYIPVESSRSGSLGIYSCILPVGYKLTELHIVDPFDSKKKPLKMKKHFRYDVFYDCESKIEIVQMDLRSARGSFSFVLEGEASNDDNSNVIEYKEQRIYLDKDINNEYFFDDGIKKSFWENLKESILLQPNFSGIGIDLKKLFRG